MDDKIAAGVHHYYWQQDYNCARTCLLMLGELFNIPIERQAFQAAVGLHGAGGFRAQCGLVEGTLMFIGIYFSAHGVPDEKISIICYRFAQAFTEHFGSLSCRDLRPSGFTEADPPHLCEGITAKAIEFARDYIQAQKV